MAKRSELKDKIFEYLKKNGVVSAAKVMEDTGASRATAFNCLRDFKNQKGTVVDVLKSKLPPAKDIKPKAAPKFNSDSKPKRRVRKKADPITPNYDSKISNQKMGTMDTEDVPEHMRRLPKFGLVGFHFSKGSRTKPGEVVWTNRVYKGLCPTCGETIPMIKNLLNSKARYTGTCRQCNISTTIEAGK
jgi:hypothetical protein